MATDLLPPTSDPCYEVCGVRIAAVTPLIAAERIVSAARRGGGYEVHLCNAFTLSLVDRDERLSDALTKADLNLPDGAPVAWVGRRVGARGPVRGSGLVREVATLGIQHGLRHFLYGGGEGVAEDMAAQMSRAFPGLRIAGVETPPFRDISDPEFDAVAERLSVARPDIVWIGVGTPRQDYAVASLARRLGVPVVPVGAAFDFWAGRVHEAPVALQGSGLEWLYRFAREPRRLWRRYTVGNIQFLHAAYRHRPRKIA